MELKKIIEYFHKNNILFDVTEYLDEKGYYHLSFNIIVNGHTWEFCNNEIETIMDIEKMVKSLKEAKKRC